jgi:hypothetical protein
MTNLVEATQEDQNAFKKGLEELLATLSLQLSLSIVATPIGIKTQTGENKVAFANEPTIILQKKVEVPDTSEPEAPKITDVKAEPTISPFVPQPNTDENTSTT